jgi:hypothetical protein
VIRCAVLLAVLGLGCATEAPRTPSGKEPAVEAQGWEWTLTLSPDLGTVDGRVCFEGVAAGVLSPELPRAAKHLVRATRVVGGVEEAVQGPSIPLAGLRAGDCVRYVVDVGAFAREGGDPEEATFRGGALMASPDVWLWRPAPWPANAQARLRFALPAGVEASVPFPVDARGRFVVAASTFRFRSQAAFGALRKQSFDVAGARFQVAMLPGTTKSTPEGVRRWLSSAGEAVALVSGRFPVDALQALVLPVASRGEPVPFGLVVRGGGPTAMLLLNEDAPDRDLVGEWVAVHEMSHLLLPGVGSRDAWLSEGLATYYQNLLRARGRLRSVDEAWDEMLDGFARGQRRARTESLLEASAGMHENGSYVRVYWGGAAFWFALDVAMRLESGGARSLDDLVAAARRAFPIDAQVTAEALLDVMDGAAGAPIAHRLFDERVAAAGFPSLGPELHALGVLAEGGVVTTTDEAPLAHIRRALTEP